MRSRILLAGVLFLGTAFAATHVGAQSEPGFMICETQNEDSDFVLAFELSFEPVYYYDVAAVVLPVYAGGQSISPIYLPGDGSNSDGSEITILEKFKPGTDPEDNCVLQGAYVWMEYGDWYYTSGNWWWWTSGECSSWYWITCPGTGCFSSGTQVLTPEGNKPIEQFKAGDWVLSAPHDDPNVPATARRVKEVIPSRGKLLDISLSGKVVHTTREHPFYVKGKGWTRAASLVVGDQLRGHDDRWVPVEPIEDAADSAVYNLSVEENGTYFVGSRDWGFSVWVYGACNGRKAPLKQIIQSMPAGSHFPKGNSALQPGGLAIGDGSRPGTSLRFVETGLGLWETR